MWVFMFFCIINRERGQIRAGNRPNSDRFSQIQFGRQIMFHSMTHAFAILHDMDIFSPRVGRRNETANENYAFI